MHEWNLVENIIETIKSKIDPDSRVTQINIRAGELKGTDKKIIVYVIKELSKGTPLENSEINVVIEKATFKCDSCGHEWQLDSDKVKEKHEELHEIQHNPNLINTFTACPKCNSKNFQVIKGNEFWVEDIKVTK